MMFIKLAAYKLNDLKNLLGSLKETKVVVRDNHPISGFISQYFKKPYNELSSYERSKLNNFFTDEEMSNPATLIKDTILPM